MQKERVTGSEGCLKVEMADETQRALVQLEEVDCSRFHGS